jgi:hypothetical protein
VVSRDNPSIDPVLRIVALKGHFEINYLIEYAGNVTFLTKVKTEISIEE